MSKKIGKKQDILLYLYTGATKKTKTLYMNNLFKKTEKTYEMGFSNLKKYLNSNSRTKKVIVKKRKKI
ncbi:MAG: hypothetical protein DRM98_04780 [Thermoplasmata archaeon]|nr:MAG: hypothetical protein DRM98_04780 [Thermoplasmata archaeon]RLF49993.1 MAG: hypothetical protein DRN24_07260 [Thermoplasmata archaeon]